MDEGWVDYTVESPDAGIVNNPGDHPEITKALLVEMNEREGETNIASGFHAIEFLLWGQDLSADGPGQRLASDYVPGEAANAQRRAAYLRAAADLLTDHLSEVVQAWDADNPDNYGDKLLAEDSSEALQKIFTGIGMLAGDELAGERMAVAYETQDQEDEHSCFSDSTRADLIANALGIHNVYRGQWSDKVNGPGLDALLAASAPEARREVDDALRQALKAIRAIPQPFDQALLGDDDAPARVALLKAVEASEDLADAIARAAESLGLSINIEAES
jgi:putative iron-regulated protein